MSGLLSCPWTPLDSRTLLQVVLRVLSGDWSSEEPGRLYWILCAQHVPHHFSAISSPSSIPRRDILCDLFGRLSHCRRSRQQGITLKYSRKKSDQPRRGRSPRKVDDLKGNLEIQEKVTNLFQSNRWEKIDTAVLRSAVEEKWPSAITGLSPSRRAPTLTKKASPITVRGRGRSKTLEEHLSLGSRGPFGQRFRFRLAPGGRRGCCRGSGGSLLLDLDRKGSAQIPSNLSSSVPPEGIRRPTKAPGTWTCPYPQFNPLR